MDLITGGTTATRPDRTALERSLLEILDAALEIAGTDLGNLQLLNAASGQLRIAAQRGFTPAFCDFFDGASSAAACSAAMRLRERVIVEDVAASALFAGTLSRDVLLAAGVRAVQSTPLIGSVGDPVGVLSTHNRAPHRPSDRALALIDGLALRAVALIEQAEAAQAPTDASTRHGFRVLIADDNHDSAWSLATLLEYAGYETRIAHDGIETLAIVAEFTPHVAILDLGMPRKDGYAVARELRARQWPHQVRLLALTGRGLDEDRRATHEAGFDHHLLKPIDPAHVQALLDRLRAGD